MTESFAAALAEWEAYFLLMGTAGATLVGLQFVAISLASTVLSMRPYSGISTFVTPTLLHFTYVLVIGAVFLMRRLDPLVLSGLLAAVSLTGLGFMFPRSREVRQQRGIDSLVWGNWIWYFGLPFLAHILLLVAVPFVFGQQDWSVFIVAGGALLLLVVGIRNSWDLVLWIARRGEPQQ